jgi:non-ribosomal peptide synthetase component F
MATLEPLPVQYADFAAWQQSLMAGEGATRAESHWRESLSGAPALLQLPFDYTRPVAPTYRAATFTSSLSADVLWRVGAVARRLGVNAQAVLLAAVQLVLMQYSRQDDLVVGVPLAGRDQAETQDLIGYFINTLPVRATSSEGDRFSDLARRASKSVVQGLENGFLPLARILQVAGVQRTPNVNPLFQVLFQYLPSDQNIASGLKLGSITAETVRSQGGQAQAKMDMIITLGDSGRLTIEYMAELFEDSTIARMSGSIVEALHQVLETPDKKLDQISLLTAADRELVMKFAAPSICPENASAPLMHHAFEAVSKQHPDRPCLQFEGAVMSYGEVNAAANRMAHALIGLGLGYGKVVGIMLERSFDLVISILGALKSGAGYLPCDPEYPDDRLAIYLEDANAVVLLTDSTHFIRASSLVDTSCHVVNVASLHGSTSAGNSENPPADRSSPDGTAYIIFTSGSTGRPKGVMVPHRGVRDLMPWLVELHGLGEVYVVFA